MALDASEIDTGLELNRRNDGRPRVHIDLPIYGGGMSFGSVSIHVMLARARAATAWNTFTCTGEGGYPERLEPYDDHVITQVATGLFGVREETIQRVRIVEFKYAQGAKPGLGGHLLGDKNTPEVARMRQAVVGNALFSPFPFHSVYSVEDHKKHVDWIKLTNPKALVSVKVSTPTDVDMVAVGSYYAGAHIIHLDGSYGGTGAAPDIAKKNIAMPIEYAIPRVHKFLVAEGIRDEVVLIASGGIRTAHDVLKSIALGADGAVIGTAELVALGCIRCGGCESGRGCARGIATTDPELMLQVDIDWGTQRLINLFAAWREQIVGRSPAVRHEEHRRAAGSHGLSLPPGLCEGRRGGPCLTRLNVCFDPVRRCSHGRPPAVAPRRRRGGRMRRHRVRMLHPRARPPHLCALLADAQPGQRQGRRDRRRRPRAARTSAYRRRSSTPTTCCRSLCSTHRLTQTWSGSASGPSSTSPSPMRVPTVDDYRDVPGLEVQPPDVHRYLVRVKPDVLQAFAEKNGLGDLPPRDIEDEFVFRNSTRLNETFYSSLGEKKAFVLSHGRNLLVFKIVGYAEQIVQYYQLEDLHAHVWIAHQRYPTKGRVWHPGGAHPFVGLNEALVHNGDFANYHSVTEYLLQRNIRPQFLTDTEVSVLLFDLWARVYKYPLEYVIEALAPTTELDFDQLPEDKQRIYRRIQAAHIHGSPDGPWFFIIARSLPDEKQFQLLGITDTAMLRPQVFALSEGDVQVGLICSEKQAIDATLRSLAQEDQRFCPIADRYWNARGGSHTDGGAFIFTVAQENGSATLTCTDKFGRVVSVDGGRVRCDSAPANVLRRTLALDARARPRLASARRCARPVPPRRAEPAGVGAGRASRFLHCGL